MDSHIEVRQLAVTPDCSSGAIEARLSERPALLSLYRLWDGKRDGRRMPAREDFDALELTPWWGNLNMVEVEPGSGRFRYRIFGSRIAAHCGYDLTGRYVDQIASRIVAEEIIKTYRAVALTAEPLFWEHGANEHGAPGFKRRRLLLPLGRNNAVTTIIDRKSVV